MDTEVSRRFGPTGPTDEDSPKRAMLAVAMVAPLIWVTLMFLTLRPDLNPMVPYPVAALLPIGLGVSVIGFAFYCRSRGWGKFPTAFAAPIAAGAAYIITFAVAVLLLSA